MNRMNEPDYGPDDLSVKVSELLVATADGADSDINRAVPEVLHLLRERMKMDVVFVSEFVDGKRVFRHVANPPGKQLLSVGAGDPLEASWCQRVVDGRMPQLIQDAATHPATRHLDSPFPIGAHLSTPIVLKDGSVYGTLCCFSHTANTQLNDRDLKNLQLTAQLTASKIDQTEVKLPRPDVVPDWSLEQKNDPKRRF